MKWISSKRAETLKTNAHNTHHQLVTQIPRYLCYTFYLARALFIEGLLETVLQSPIPYGLLDHYANLSPPLLHLKVNWSIPIGRKPCDVSTLGTPALLSICDGKATAWQDGTPSARRASNVHNGESIDQANSSRTRSSTWNGLIQSTHRFFLSL